AIPGSYRRNNNTTETTASNHNVGGTSRARPTHAYKSVCRMKPHRIPSVIENVSGMRTSVTNAGTESSTVVKSICETIWNIAAPTSTSTGAVAYAGTAAASGATKKHGRKQSAVTTDARPVRPPIRIPAMLSTYAVPADVPASPARNVANASTIRRRRRVKGVPSGSITPAAVETPMNVDSESNRSVKRIEIIAGSSAGRSAEKTSSLRKALEKSGRLTTRCGSEM